MAQKDISIHYVELRTNAEGSLEEVLVLKADSPAAQNIRVRRRRDRQNGIAGAKNRASVDRKTGDMLEILSCFVDR